MIRRVYGALALGLLIFPWSQSRAEGLLCSQVYEETRLRQHLSELEKIGNPNFLFPDDPGVQVTVSQTVFPVKSWKVQKIQTKDNEEFVGLDVGLAHFEKDQESYVRPYRKHLASSEYKRPFYLEQSGELKDAVEEAKKWRWGFHDAVIDAYLNHPHKQKYLNLFEISSLMSQTAIFENSDVFGIIAKPTKSLKELTRKEVRGLALVSIQLSFYSPEYTRLTDFDSPRFLSSIRGKKRSLRLPFIFRMEKPFIKTESTVQRAVESGSAMISEKPVNISEFLQQFEKEFAGKKLGEINRFLNADPNQPQALRDLAFLMMLERAEEKGIDVLFASGDRASSRLFKRDYAMSDYVEIHRKVLEPNGEESADKVETEYAMVLYVGSEKYVELKRKLQDSVRALRTKTEAFIH